MPGFVKEAAMVADMRISALNRPTADSAAIGIFRPPPADLATLHPSGDLRPPPPDAASAELPPRRPMPGGGFDRLAGLGRIRPFPIILNLPAPRSQTTVPIAPFGNIAPDTVYEDPADPAKHCALPTFNLAVQTVDGKSRLRVAFEKAQPGDPASQQWLLTVRFGSALRGPDFRPLPFTPAVLLRFTPPVAEATPKELPFIIEQEEPATWKATLLRNGLTERDEAVNALKTPEYQAHFVIRSAFQAAVPDSVSDTGEQLYRKGSYSVDIPLDRAPFFIDPTAHPYVYTEAQDASSQVFGLKLHQVELSWAAVMITAGPAHRDIAASTDPERRYRFDSLEPGSYTVTANASGHQPREGRVTATAGEMARLDFTVE